ncbi:MAG TPA: outer membrane beta-barrel protein [Acidobacteriaceae bacterium]
MPNLSRIALCMLLATGTSSLWAQGPSRVDLGITFTSQRSLRANTGQNFWMEGGSAQLGFNLRGGLGFAADFTGSHTASIGSSGVPLVLTATTVGPRYRWRAAKKVSFYGEGLFGFAHGSDSLFPTNSGTNPSASSFAWQLGGGLDWRVSHHFSVRMIDAGYLRTTLPNNSNNVQNLLRLGAGAVLRF